MKNEIERIYGSFENEVFDNLLKSIYKEIKKQNFKLGEVGPYSDREYWINNTNGKDYDEIDIHFRVRKEKKEDDMTIEEILENYKGETFEYESISVEALESLMENGMLSDGFNSAPSGETLLAFIKKWPFATASGHSDGRRLYIEEVSGQIPAPLTSKNSDLIELFSDMLNTFERADEQSINEEGSFRFWFD